MPLPQPVYKPVPPVNHALHIILCLLTAGLWLPVYLVILLNQSARRYNNDRALGRRP